MSHRVSTLAWLFSIAASAHLAVLADQPTPRELYLTGRYQEALEAFQEEAAPTPESLIDRAGCHLATGDLTAAERVLKGAIQQHPQAAILHAELARLELDRGNYRAARMHLDASLQLDAECITAKWLDAQWQRLHGKIEEALAGYEWCVKHYSSGAAIGRSEDRHAIGLAAAQYARWARNHDQFRRLVGDLYPEILSREPKYWPAQLEMGRLFAEKYNEADATDALNAGLAINPQAADLHVLRAQLALDKFDLSTARSAAERALEANPQHLGAHRAKADMLLADVRPAEAIDVLLAARQLQPRDEETAGRLAAAYLALDGTIDGRPSERVQLLIDETTKQNSHAGEFHLAAGDALDRMRRYPQAAEQYRLAQQKMPELISTRGKLGMTLMRLGDEAEAARLLDEAFTIDPFNVRVKNTLEVLDVLQGYAVIETEHFIIKFDRGQSELLATYASRYLEREVYPQLIERFGYKPEGKTLIEIFSRSKSTSGHGWFSARMVGLPAIGTIGACAGRMIALTSPDELPKKYDWARVLRHEYVHVLNLQQTDFSIPHWFTEGLAVYSEQGPRPRQWDTLLSRRAREQKLLDLDSLTLGFVRPSSSDDWTLAYCQAALHVDYMLDKFGPDAAGKMLAAYAERKSTAEAIQQALGVGQEEYERGYREFIDSYLDDRGLSNDEVAPPLAELLEAAEADDATADAKAKLARAYLDRKNLPSARRWALAVQTQDESQPLAAYVMARVHLSIGDTDAAVAELKRGLNEEKPHQDVLALLAAHTQQAGDLIEAERLLLLGQKHFPHTDRWLKGLARIYLSQPDEAKLAPVLEKLAALEPDSTALRKKLAELALARGDFAAARRFATELIHLNLADAEAHAQLAAAARGEKDLPLATEEFETAVALDGEQPAWRFDWAQVLAELGRKSEARRVADELKGQAPEHPGLAELLEKLRD